LLVDPQAQLILAEGAELTVERLSAGLLASAPAGATFENGASLRYGPLYGQPISRLEVHDWFAGPGRFPKLQFKANSYITTELPIDPLTEGIVQELLLTLYVHFDIESKVSWPPALSWHTGDVDLAIEATGTLVPPVQMECIASDSCNIWFTDVPEPRCLKHWRSLTIGGNYVLNLELVDHHDNHQPNAVPCGDSAPTEAMYVLGDISAEDIDDGQSTVNLNGLRLYYGGSIPVWTSGSPFLSVGGEPFPLIKTNWGDFDGDCDIDVEDALLFPLSNAVPPVTYNLLATNPLFDHDGDCRIGEHEYELFYCRFSGECPMSWTTCNGGAGGVALVCPPTPRAPEFGQGFFVPAAGFAQAQTIAICIPVGIGPNSIAIRVKGSDLDSTVACVDQYVQADGTLAPSADYQPADSWETIRVADPNIVPNAQYELQIEYATGLLSLPAIVTTRLWGDADGSGVVDVADILCLLDLFGGASIPSCNPGSGDFYPCVPDEVIDISDILAVLDAFAGIQFSAVCPMPCESGLMAPGGGEGAMSEGGAGPMGGGVATGTIRLERAQKTIAVGGLAGVHVFVSDVSELRGWQFALDSLAANGAVFAWEVLTVDDARSDYVFFGLDDFPATDMTQGRVALAGGGVSPSAEKYLGTVWFRVTSLGGGSMTVSLDESHTQLRDSAGQSMNVVNLGPVTINIVP
jgi:hypothetical protein